MPSALDDFAKVPAYWYEVARLMDGGGGFQAQPVSGPPARGTEPFPSALGPYGAASPAPAPTKAPPVDVSPALWADLDEVGRANLLLEYESMGYQTVSADVSSLTPPTLRDASDGGVFRLWEWGDVDIAGGDGLRIEVTDGRVIGIPWWALAAVALAGVVIIIR